MIKLYRTVKGEITLNKAKEFIGEYDIRINQGKVFVKIDDGRSYLYAYPSIDSFVRNECFV